MCVGQYIVSRGLGYCLRFWGTDNVRPDLRGSGGRLCTVCDLNSVVVLLVQSPTGNEGDLTLSDDCSESLVFSPLPSMFFLNFTRSSVPSPGLPQGTPPFSSGQAVGSGPQFTPTWQRTTGLQDSRAHIHCQEEELWAPTRFCPNHRYPTVSIGVNSLIDNMTLPPKIICF